MPRRRESPAARRRRIHERALQRREAYLNSPERITAPLTPRDLDRELGAAERSRFGDEDRLLQGEYAGSRFHAQRGAQWFQDYQNTIRQAEERTRAYYQGQQDAQNQLAAQSFQQDTSRSQALNQQAQADAQRRGASVDPALAQTAEQAAASRRTSSQQQANLTGTLGANQGAYLAQRGIAAAGQGLQFQQDEARRGQGIQRRQRDVAREKGEFRVAYRQKAREDERRYGLERAAFGLREQDLAADIADDVADNQRQSRSDRSRARDRSARQQQSRDRQNLSRAQFIAKYGITPEEAAQGVDPTRGTSETGGRKPRLTPSERKGYQRKWKNAVAQARQVRQIQGNRVDENELYTALLEKYDAAVAKGAAQMVFHNGRVGPKTAHELALLGIHPPRFQKRGRRKPQRTIPGL